MAPRSAVLVILLLRSQAHTHHHHQAGPCTHHTGPVLFWGLAVQALSFGSVYGRPWPLPFFPPGPGRLRLHSQSKPPPSCVVLASHPSPSHRFASARYKSLPHSRLGSPALPVWFSAHPDQLNPILHFSESPPTLTWAHFVSTLAICSISCPSFSTARAITAKFVPSKFSFVSSAFESCLAVVSRLDPSHSLFPRPI